MALRREEENLWSGEHVYFRYEGKSASGATEIWSLLDGNMGMMGHIKWYGPWRRYAWSTVGMPIMESGCLRDVADFLDKLTEERKNARTATPTPARGKGR
jgi:hypothetical protein